ncbi:hypothetical protein B1A99_17530 [Cohnella sp. CIP 111063]|uniref:response regulator n=1 Tax=unclassified Cohnella TaxID=2636738 RepID=UPI000B8BD585|nr:MULTISPECIES: response regulator [unclassified Cohnella]OXS57290.1 hypothetical protein B1A99_17530 [Cohnella sp. CIP 111063]PRX70730.1 helix-turn-helix protein [Cohnella sp. SGD-V74]
MKKIMIVDDESLVRVGLQSIIPWEEYGYCVSGVYHNGREALEACRASMPDAILTDIRMPVMDGLELIKNVRQLSERVPIVILSSYDDFEYTRTAIRLGVQDYIQKHQLEPEELIRVLNALKIEETGYAGEAVQHDLKKEKEDLLDRTSWVDTAGSGREEGERRRAYPELEKLAEERGPYACWVMIQPFVAAWGEERSPLSYALIVREELERYRYTEYLGARGSVVHALFYLGEEMPGAESLRRQVSPFCGKLLESLRGKCNMDFAIGISRPMPFHEYDAMHAGAGSALLSMFYGTGGIYYDNGSAARSVYADDEWIELYKTLKRDVRQERFDELLRQLDEPSPAGAGEIDPREWKRIGATVATQLTDYLIEQYELDVEKIKQHFGDLWPLERYIDKASHKAAWLSSVRLVFERAGALIASVRANKTWLTKIKQYVNENYAEPIRLEDAAALVYWSENYFSQRFSQETGMTFLEYLTSVRIERAKELLRSADRSTEEIAGLVGYVNANYFVKVFKKTTGLTLSEFKARHKG